jgi:cell division protein FtsL
MSYDFHAPEKTRKGLRRKTVVTLLGGGLLSFALLLLYLWQYISILGLNYDIDNNKRKLHQLEDQRRNLTMTYLQYKSLEQIGDIARKKLGMKPPDKNQIIVIEERMYEENE